MKVPSELGYGRTVAHQSVQIGKALSVDVSHPSLRSGTAMKLPTAPMFSLSGTARRSECRPTTALIERVLGKGHP